MMWQCLGLALARVRVSLARAPHLHRQGITLQPSEVQPHRGGAILQGIGLALAAACSIGAALLSSDVDAASVCAAPARDTIATSGIINSYWGGVSVSNGGGGNATLTLGNQRTGAANTPLGSYAVPSTPISAGDLLVLMQMQGTNVGAYEYVTAVSTAGTAITIRGTGTNGGVVNSYTQSFGDGSTFQVIRVPQVLNASLGNYTAPAWDIDASGYGTGGVFVIDVAQQASLNGTIDVSGQGFRGGAGFNLTGNAAGLNSSSSAYASTSTTGGSKGEGTGGTPGYVFDGYAATIKEYNTTGLANAAYTLGNAPVAADGNYGGASFGFGAIGSAGGGGNDSLPGSGTNQYNSGGAGGGSAGRGGQGGWTWVGTAAYCSTTFTPTNCGFVSTGTGTTGEGITDSGGRGGMAVGGLSAGKVVMGGGGGASSVNNNTVANTVSTYPPIDVATDPNTLSGGSTTVSSGAQGAISGSGARGGGIVMIRAGTFSAGAGQINANGERAYNMFGAGASEAAAGGGGGGAVVVLAQAASGTLTANALGGRGGDSDFYAHGPGGGGGGGFILTNFSLSGTVDKGGSGYTPNIGTSPANYTFPNHYGSDAVDGNAGYLSTAGGTTPGTSSGAACEPDVAATVTLPTSGAASATVSGSLNYVDNGPSDAQGVGYAATLTAGLGTVTFGTPTLNGVTLTGVTESYNDTTGVITIAGLPTTIPNTQSVVLPVSFTMPSNATSVTATDTVTESTTDPVPSNNNGTATVNGSALADDAVTITGLPSTANPNTSVFGVLNFVNNGPSTSLSTVYTAKLPVGASVSSIKYNGTTLSGASATVGSDGTVTFSGLPATLNSSDTVTVAFNASMPANGSSVAVTTSIASSTTDSNVSNNTASAIVNGTGMADLATTIAGLSTAAQAAGSAIAGTVTFQNNGPNTAITPVYTVQVPPGSTITASQVLYNGSPVNGVTVTIDQYGNVTFGGSGLPTSLNSGDKVTVGFNGTMPADGSNANVVSSISSASADPNLNNNNATATTPGISAADLQSTVTGFPTFAQASGTVETGTITFANNGPSSATGVAYTSSLSGTPSAVTLGTPQLNGVAISGATATYNASTGAVTYAGLPTTLNSGDKITVPVTFTMPGNPVVIATNIQSNTTDPVTSNNSASVTVNGGNDLSVVLSGFKTGSQATNATETGVITYSDLRGASAAAGAYTPVLSLTPGLTGLTFTASGTATNAASATASYDSASGTVTFTNLPTLTAGQTLIFTAANFTMPATNVVVSASISETPNIDTYTPNNSATTTLQNSTATKADMATTVTGLGGVAAAGSTVSSGVINYTNLNTANTATGTSFAATLPVGATVTAITLNGAAITGASATVAANGVVTFSGMPTSVAASGVVAVSFSFPMPANGSSAIATGTITSSNDSNTANNTASATETGDAPTDLQTIITEPSSAAPSTTITGQVRYINNGPTTAVSPTYQLTLPVAGGTPTITSVTLNGSLLSVTTSIAANGVVTFTGLPNSLNSGDDLMVNFTAKMPANGSSISTTGQITYPGTDTVPSNNSATATTTGNPNAPTVMVTKTVDHTTHNTGDSVTWTLTVTNTGTSATSGVITLTDTLPSNISNVVVTTNGASCTPSSPTAGTTLTCSVPAGLAASNGTATVTIAATLLAAGSYNNTVTPSGNASDNPTCAQNACSTVTVVGSATMQVIKDSVDGVGTFGYTLTNMSATSDSITTQNPNTATQGVINVVTSLSSAITVQESSSPAGYSITSASCIDTNGAADGNGSAAIGTLSGTTLTIPVANVKQNAVLQCTFVNTITQAISIAKTGPTAMMVGNPYNYTLTLTNTSTTNTVTTVTVKDQLPAGFTYNSESGLNWSCSAAAQLLTCSYSGGTLAPKATSTLTISATPTATATNVINYATVDATGGTNAAAPAGCTASSTCALSPAATVTATGLAIAKSAPTPGLAPNVSSTYTLTVTNNGTTAATAATIKDVLPAQLTLITATGTGWACTSAGQTTTCSYAGSIAAGGTSTIAVTVKPGSDAVVGGSLTNYASIDPTGGTAPPTPGANCTPVASCASQTSTVSGPNVQVTKSVDQANHSIGDTITWIIKAANTGASASSAAITLTDTLPTGVSNIVATPSSGLTCTPAAPAAGGTLTCTVPAGLAANTGVATVTITATATATGTITNSVSPSGMDNPTCASGACSASTTVSGQSLTLQKALTGNRINSGDQFTVQIKNGATVMASATTTGSGNGVANGSTGETPVVAGTAYTLSEIAAGSTSLAQYGSALACSNANTSSSTNLPSAVGATVTPAAGDRITCTITNSAQPVLTLVKALAAARVQNTDQFTLQIANGGSVAGSATTSGSGSTLANNSTGITTLVAGTTYTIGEIAATGTGTQLADYTSSLACTNATAGSTTPLPTTVGGTVTPAGGDNISCTLTNSPKAPVLTLLGALTGSRVANTDQFTFAIASSAGTVATTTTAGSGATLSNATTGVQTLVAGTNYALTEAAAGTTNLNQYTSTLSCTNADSASTTTLPTTLPANLMPAPGDSITCTVAIVAKAPTVNLIKALGSNRQSANDQFVIEITSGATTVASATTSGTGNTLAANSTGATTLTPGTTYTLTEVAASGTDLTQYTKALACTNTLAGSSTTLPTAVPGNVTPQDGDAITCTLTNTGTAVLATSKVLTQDNGATPGTSIKDGDVLTYTLTLQNSGALAGTSVLTETVPASTAYTGTGEGWSAGCSTAGTTCSQSVTAPGASSVAKTFTVTVAASVTATAVVNTVTSSVGSCTSCSVSTPVAAATLVTNKTLLTVNGAAPGSTVKAGDVLIYQLAVQNTGGSNGTTTLGETVPAGTSYSGTGEGWGSSCSAAGTTCTQSVTLDGGVTTNKTFTVTLAAPTTTTTVANTATSSSGSCTNCSVTTNTASADVLSTVTYTAMTVNAGATATVNLAFTNNGPSTATGVTYSTTLTAGLLNVMFPTLPAGVTASYNTASGVVTYTGLPTSLISAQSEAIGISYTQPATPSSSTSTMIATTTRDPNTGNNSATASVAGALEADMAAATTFPATVNAGGAVTGTVVFTNNGPSPAAGVTYTTTLTSGLANVAFSNLPTGVSASYNSANGVVTYTGLPTSLASAASESITVSYTQNASANSTVTATDAATTADPISANNSSSSNVTGNQEADVAATVTFPATVNAGGTVTGTVVFTNNGPSTAAGVTYSTTLTSGLSNVVFSNLPTGVSASYNSANGVVSYTGLPTSLASAASDSITIGYTQPGTAASTVQSSIATTTPDPVASNNSANANVGGAAVADVSTTVTYAPTTVNAGAMASVTVVFADAGPSAAAGMTYDTTLTTGLANVLFPTLPTGVGASYNATNGVVTYTGLATTLASGANQTVVITYTQPATATSSTQAGDATTSNDPNMANNNANTTVSGSVEADLAVATTFPATVNAGNAVSGTVVFTNNGPSPAAGVTYTTTLTAALPDVTFSNLPAGVTASYNATNGVVTYTGLSTTLAAGASASITVSYTQPPSATSKVVGTDATTTADPNSANNTSTSNIGGNQEADVATTTTFPATVNSGSTVTGTVLFTNNGPSSAAAVTYTTTLSTGLANVAFSNLPAGVSASYNATNGVVTYTGLSTTLASGASESITVSYLQNGTASSTVQSSIATTTADPVASNNSANATIGGTEEADLQTVTTFPAKVNAGSTVTGTVVFTDHGPSPAAGVAYTTMLTSGLANVAFSNLPTGVSASYNSANGVVTYTGLPTSLASAASESITISYTQNASANSTVTATDATTTADPNSANNSATSNVTGNQEADVATTVTFPATVNAGSLATGTVVFTNNGPSSAAGVTYTTTLTSGLANVVFSNLPTGVSASYNSANGVVTYTGLPTALASAASESITISFTQNASANSIVTATDATTSADPNSANNTSSVNVTGNLEADVTTTAVYTPTTVNAGATAAVNITFSNLGPSPAAAVTYGTTLTTGLTNVTFPTLPSGATASYNPTSGVVSYTGLATSLASGASQAIGIRYIQPGSATSAITTTIATTTADPNSANNTAMATVSGAAETDVATVSTFPASINAGNAVTGTVVFSNNGPSPAAGVTYTTTLTTGLANVVFSNLPTGVSASYNSGNGVVTYTGLPTTLPSGQSESIGISYTQPAAGDSTVTGSDATTSTDTNAANNTSTASIAGNAEADLQTVTTFPAAANPGVTVTGTVVFKNNGPSAAVGVSYSTTLSAGLTNVAFSNLPTGVTASYNATTGAVTYTGLPTSLSSGASESIGLTYTQPASGASSAVQGGISATTADPNSANNTATANVTGTAQADLATTLNVPASVNAGAIVTGTIGFTNNGPSPATSVAYGLTLQAGLANVTFSNLPAGVTASYSATGGVTFTGLPTMLTVSQSVAPITFSYTQLASGSSTVSGSITSATTDPNSANNNVTDTVGGVTEADTSATLTFPADANAGATVSGTLVFSNAGPSTANAVTYALTLTTGLTNVAFPGLPTGVTASYNATSGAVTFTGLPSTLTSGQTLANIAISYTQPAGGSSSVSAMIASTTTDPNSANNSPTANVGGNPEADSSVVINFPGSVAGLQPVSGTVTFSNAGPSIANGVSYTLTLSQGLSNVTFANLPAGVTASYNVVTGVVSFTGMPSTLAVGQSVGPITVGYTQPGNGTSSVTGTIGSTTADPNSANNTATSNVAGTAADADLAILTSAAATVAPDGALVYTLTITNNGPAAANNASFSDSLPAALGTATASCAPDSGAAVCGPVAVNGHTVSGTLSSLPSGATAVITINTTAPASGSVTNTATVTAPAGITDPVPANNTSSVTTTVGAVGNSVDLSVTQSGTTTVQPSGTVTYVVDVVDGGPAAANNSVFTYTTATVVTNVTWTCQAVGGGAICPAASGAGNNINQTIATFPNGGHLVYTITGTAPAAPQQYVDTATITPASGVTDSNTANNTATVTTGVQAAAAPSADVAVTITGPTTAQPGAPVSYTVVVTDNGPSPANGSSLSVPVAGVVTNVATTCTATGGAVCPTVGAGNNVDPTIPTLPAGGELTFTITGTAPSSGTFSTSVTVTPPAGSNDPVPSNNTAGPVVTTVPVLSADLSIQKNGPAQVIAGGIVNYTITVSNAGPNSADGASVTDALPATLTGATAVCSGASGGAVCGNAVITGGTMTAIATTLPIAGSITLTVSGHAPASGTLSNSATVTVPPGVTDPNPANNIAGPVQTTVVASVPAQADLSANITGPPTVAPNGTVTYVLTITNSGPAAGDGAVVSDTLPAVLTNIHATCGNALGAATCGAISVTGNSVASTIAALPVGASVTLTITATAPASGSFNNSASVSPAPGKTDPNTANNVAGPVVTSIGATTGTANLGISKTGPDNVGAGSVFSYTLVVSNAGPASADGAMVADPVPAGLTKISATCSNPTNGALCGPVLVSGQNVTSKITTLPALGTVTLTITVTAPIPGGLQPTTVVNRATVTPPPGITDPDSSDNVSGAVETSIVSAGVSGAVWLDLNHDKKLDAGDPLLPNWIVELFHNGVLVAATTTNAQGQYSFSGVAPGPGYSIDFRDPGSKAIYGTPTNGNEGVPNPDSDAVIGNGIIESLTLKPGINIVQQSLPVDPSGVVYDAASRAPVGGATVTLVGPAGFNPATELVGGAANDVQITGGVGLTAGDYQFLLINPGAPGGAPAGTYTIVVTPPGGYLAPPAKTGGVAQPGGTFTVPGPVNASTAIQPNARPPKVGDNGTGTTYYLNLVFNAGAGAVINNHIPLDRISGGALTVSKEGNTSTADIGETVLYTIDVTTTLGTLPNVTVTDRLPRGFTLIPNTTTINGVHAADPKGASDGDLIFSLGTVSTGSTAEIKYRVRVGVGAQQGDGVNRAQAQNPLGASSNVATFKVDVNGGVFTTNACVVGKVFVDCNGNQIQDQEEPGIPGVRLYFSDGTFVVTDSEGKFSYCGLRPTTHTLKVDRSTLPLGSVLVESSNRNALDPNSLFIDLKNGELHQADFIEGSCSTQVMEEIKARRGQGEVNASKPVDKTAPALIFDSRPLSIVPASGPVSGAPQ